MFAIEVFTWRGAASEGLAVQITADVPDDPDDWNIGDVELVLAVLASRVPIRRGEASRVEHYTFEAGDYEGFKITISAEILVDAVEGATEIANVSANLLVSASTVAMLVESSLKRHAVAVTLWPEDDGYHPQWPARLRRVTR